MNLDFIRVPKYLDERCIDNSKHLIGAGFVTHIIIKNDTPERVANHIIAYKIACGEPPLMITKNYDRTLIIPFRSHEELVKFSLVLNADQEFDRDYSWPFTKETANPYMNLMVIRKKSIHIRSNVYGYVMKDGYARRT